MFDSFLSSVKSQTTQIAEQLSASLNDLRFTKTSDSNLGQGRTSSMSSTLQNSLGSLKKLVGRSTENTQQYSSIPKSQSSHIMSATKQQELKWPVLVNNERQWVSSSSLYTGGRSQQLSQDGDDSDSESDTVFRNPALQGRDYEDDDLESGEESLVDRFDRVLATGKSAQQVCRYIVFKRSGPHWYFLFHRDEMIVKKSGDVWLWELKMRIFH